MLLFKCNDWIEDKPKCCFACNFFKWKEGTGGW
jgi:hypothetical protein